MTKYRSVSIENHRSRNDIFGDKLYEMMEDKHDQLKQSTSDNKPLLFRAHSMFCLSALFTSSGTCRVEAACTSLPDDFFLSPSVCSHANVAVVYDVDVVSSIPMLKVETSLSSLLDDVGDMVTVRERVDLAFGIVCAVEYFHEQLSLRVAHGLISCDTVFVTQQLRAKLLDPSAAFLLTGNAVSCVGDIKQLVEILLSLLSATCPAFLFACDRLRDIAGGVDRVERKGDCYYNSLSEMKGLLDGLQQTAEYR